jgi:hypothetical protein
MDARGRKRSIWRPFRRPTGERCSSGGAFSSHLLRDHKGRGDWRNGRARQATTRRYPGLARVRDTTDDPEPPNLHLFGLRDPVYPHRGVLLANWRLERQLYSTKLDRKMRFVEIASADSIQYLRRELAETAARLGLQDFDLSTVTGPMRDTTRECARSVYEMTDGDGTPLYAGILYVSRLNPEWECWAIFHDRMIHRPGFPHTISPDDPDQIAIAKLFGLSIEIFAGSGQYLRP